MNLRQRIALWVVHILCPRLGIDDPPKACPYKIEPCELHDDDLAEWAEYVASHQSTRHHLNRCLHLKK